MDDRRFDDVIRLIGSGASRRSILKSLLGLGGTAIVSRSAASGADARTLRTRSTLTTSPPPGCEPGHQFCGGQEPEHCCPPGRCFDGLCCPDEGTERCGDECVPTGQCTSGGEQCASGNPCGTVCCPADASCARSGNSDSCCGGSAGGAPCGLECCSDPLQCCDRECCASGSVCLGQVYGGYEEVCCPTEQTCDGQCCQGTCYKPLGTSLSGFERACCPAEANLCYGRDAYAGVAVCCQGATPDCCANADGSPVCLTVEQCCTSEECEGLTDPSKCEIGVCSEFECRAQSVCAEDEACCAGGDNTCCPEGQTCCGPTCCGAGLECCEREVGGTLTFTCYEAEAPGACCFDAECADSPATCEVGACLDNQTCGLRTTCGAGERCCEGSTQPAGTCITSAQCCDDGDCTGRDPVLCAVEVCEDFTCVRETTCNAGEQCCGFGDDFCCPDEETCCRREESGIASFICLASGQCCDDDDCTEYEGSYCDTSSNQCDCVPLTCQDYSEFPCGDGFPDGCGGTLFCDCAGSESCCIRETGEGDNGIEVGVCIDPDEQCCEAWDCERFGYHIDCVICTDEFECRESSQGDPCGEGSCGVCDEGWCSSVDNDTPCPDGVCCDGFCTEVESCSECELAGSTCATDGDCCSGWCCEDRCVLPNGCCEDSDCPACHRCYFNFCISDCSTGPDYCCTGDEFCYEPQSSPYGYCEACHTEGQNCSGFPYVACCDGLLCSNFTCATCVSLDEFGCSSFDDCCDDGSKFCASGACRCGRPDLYNSCTRDGDECCEGYYCTSTSTIDEPLGGVCTVTSCSTLGGDCPCCAGYLCVGGTCQDFCNYSPHCDDD